MHRWLLAFFLTLACLGASAQSRQTTAAPNLAGKVELVEGDVAIHDKAKKARRVAVGDPVYEGEGIVTGKDGELHLDMEDGGFVAVRPGTKMRIIAYQAQGDEGDQGVFGLLAGTFRSVTGWIGKFNPKRYQVRTPTATIGVRGTDHEPLVIPQGSQEGEPGSYDKVNVGVTTLRTQHGSIELRPNQAGFVPLKGRPRPRLLAQVPAFFKATRHEPAIAARHEVIHKVIDQRRDERRKLLQEKKTQIEKQQAERQQARRERQRERGMQQREERERHPPGAEERRKRIEDRREPRRQERDSRPQRHPEREHGPRGGGRGRD